MPITPSESASFRLNLITMAHGPTTKELNHDTTPSQVFLLVTKYRNCKLAQTLLWKGVEVTERDPDGLTPLHWAATNDDICTLLNILHTVTEHQPKAISSLINAQDNRGSTPLHSACVNARFQSVCILLRFNSDPNAEDFELMTPLSNLAIAYESLSFDVPKFSPTSTFVSQIQFNILKAAELLLQAGADIERKDMRGRTPLAWAVVTENTKLAGLLLANGADMDAKDDFGVSIREAVEGGFTCLTEERSFEGVPMERALQLGKPLEMCELLKKWGGKRSWGIG
ncbi:MAG: hypothetical protein MMC33_008313 [Icmadophila ericetorum]|nr:hypothetical protein [Icmadophila ericetorum]